ncbi:MAG: methyltransferase domain-containing protein [Spirochaetota bacterium]
MNKTFLKFRWPFIISLIAVIALLFVYRLQYFTVDTDLIEYLPHDDAVLTDARAVIKHLPFQDKVVIDLCLKKIDRDILVEGANFFEERLRKSGLFKNVGIDEMQKLFPPLIMHITKNLPVLFTAKELERDIKPMLSRQNIKKALNQNLAQLQNLEGIGQSEFIMYDPLDFKGHIISKLSDLVPSKKASIYRGKLISQDEKHLLIVTELNGSGTDIATSEKINDLIYSISADFKKVYSQKGYNFEVNPVGAYRAVLDNSSATKKDTERAVTISTIIIAILLIIGFPRPLVGLLALLPSILGTALAFIVYSLIHSSISVLAVGFGGAIISFTVDYGITYLLFLDRPYETYGFEATKEVWTLGLLAMLTTAVSFAFLFLSGFPALAQIGEFAALGVLFTYICVHLFFPVIFPVMPPAKRKGFLPLLAFVKKLIFSGGKYRFIAAVVFCIIMLFFAKPVFQVDISSMNSVTDKTLESENMVKDTWGNILNRIYLMSEGMDAEELQDRGDRLARMLEKDIENGVVASAFMPSMIFPGTDRANENLSAWKKFWNKKRTAEFKKNIYAAAHEAGFTQDAFRRLFDMIEKKDYKAAPMPAEFHGMFGVSKKSDTEWMQFSILTTAKDYKSEDFYSRYSKAGIKLFDPWLFSERLAKLLMSGFIKMALIVGIITVIVALLYLLDWQLALISVIPTIFSLICTFGTLNILNQPLGIPTIIIIVVVIGMGTDYAIYLVRAYQRYMDEENTSLRLVHMSVFLSFATTFAGFGLLALSSHSLLKSAGLSLGLGIGYSFIGAVMLVPPMLKYVFTQKLQADENIIAGSAEHFKHVMKRYRHIEAYPRIFARFKMKCDPMFPRLADFVKQPKQILDIGCGYGVPSAWLLAIYPDARVHALDPDAGRVYIASRVIGERGSVAVGSAPDLPAVGNKCDTALLLDMIHYLNDSDLRATLKWVCKYLTKKGKLIIRVTMPTEKKFPWERMLEHLRVKLLKTKAYFRTAAQLEKMIKEAGLKVKLTEPTKKNREETWIIAEK